MTCIGLEDLFLGAGRPDGFLGFLSIVFYLNMNFPIHVKTSML